MPLMRLACTALERVPLTRSKIIEHLSRKIHQDLVFFRAPEDNDLTSDVHGIIHFLFNFNYLLDFTLIELCLLQIFR